MNPPARPRPRAPLALLAVLFAALCAPCAAASREKPLPLEELQVFSEVFGLIQSQYVEEVDDVELLRKAIGGMLGGLDPHSDYLTPESFEALQVGTEGKFGGIGIEVTIEDGLIKVVTPIDDTPAHRAGIEPGDLIIRLDGTSVKGMALNEAVSRMRGEPGTEIELTIVREGRSGPFTLTLKRTEIKISSVRAELLDDHYGYVRITQFQVDTGANLRRELTGLKNDSDNELFGLILDLRNNPGGVLSGAISVSDVFLDEGVIVSTRGREGRDVVEYRTNSRDHLDDVPLVVLVNSGSASASEIVAGALQDHKRAVIMGSRTFGKGSVQTIVPLNNGAALRITTARYYTPSGHSIQARGIRPDIAAENLAFATAEAGRAAPLRESDLPGHLENEGHEAAPRDERATGHDDPVIHEALNLLKALRIVNHGVAP